MTHAAVPGLAGWRIRVMPCRGRRWHRGSDFRGPDPVLPVKPQPWVIASAEHHCGPHGLPVAPHIHNIVVALTAGPSHLPLASTAMTTHLVLAESKARIRGLASGASWDHNWGLSWSAEGRKPEVCKPSVVPADRLTSRHYQLLGQRGVLLRARDEFPNIARSGDAAHSSLSALLRRNCTTRPSNWEDLCIRSALCGTAAALIRGSSLSSLRRTWLFIVRCWSGALKGAIRCRGFLPPIRPPGLADMLGRKSLTATRVRLLVGQRPRACHREPGTHRG
jgi:hypothetical protein